MRFARKIRVEIPALTFVDTFCRCASPIGDDRACFCEPQGELTEKAVFEGTVYLTNAGDLGIRNAHLDSESDTWNTDQIELSDELWPQVERAVLAKLRSEADELREFLAAWDEAQVRFELARAEWRAKLDSMVEVTK